MTCQETLKTINELLPQQPQEKLEQEDDAFEKRLRADVDASKFDQLIADVITEDEARLARAPNKPLHPISSILSL